MPKISRTVSCNWCVYSPLWCLEFGWFSEVVHSAVCMHQNWNIHFNYLILVRFKGIPKTYNTYRRSRLGVMSPRYCKTNNKLIHSENKLIPNVMTSRSCRLSQFKGCRLELMILYCRMGWLKNMKTRYRQEQFKRRLDLSFEHGLSNAWWANCHIKTSRGRWSERYGW